MIELISKSIDNTMLKKDEFDYNKRWFLRMISENLLNEAIDYL